MAESINDNILNTDTIFNEATRGMLGTAAQRLAPDSRSQDSYPLSIVICLSKISLLPGATSMEEVDVSEDTLSAELTVMTERFRAVMYATVLEMSDVFSALNPKTGDSPMIDIDRKRPETSLTSWMANSLGATDDRLFITAGFTLDTTRISNLMKLLGRLDSIVIPGYIKYFRLYRVTLNGTFLIGNDGELFSSYCRETCCGRPSERIHIEPDDSRYVNIQKIYKRTFCTMQDIRESVQQAFDESYNELVAEYVSKSMNGPIDALKLSTKLFQKLQGVI